MKLNKKSKNKNIQKIDKKAERKANKKAKKQAKAKKKETQIRFRKPVQSTQQNIPIREFYRGIIITKDRRYIKVMEVKPITFDLKTSNEQARIFDSFQQVLKVAPDNVQLTVMSFPANLEKPIAILDSEIAKETNEKCLEVDYAYRDKLVETQFYTVTRRFFISFQYEGKKDLIFNAKSMSKVYYDLNRTARNIEAALSSCGNTVVPVDENYPSEQTAEILYTILNRNESIEVPFKDNLQNVLMRYAQRKNGELTLPDFIAPTEYISPKTISFMNSKYIVANGDGNGNGTYYTFLYIPKTEYAPNVIPAWTRIFINSYDGVDVNIYLNRKSKEKVMNDIRRNITYSQVGAESSSSASAAFDSSLSTYESGNYLKNGLSSGQDFYLMSILLTVTGSSPEEVDEKVNSLKQTAIQTDIKLQECTFFEEKAFMSALPLCNLDKFIFDRAKRNVLTEGAASTYPFTAFEMLDDNGIYFGDNLNNNSLVLIDIFNTSKFQNPNIFICGQTGSGKTFSLLLMAIRMRIKHIPVYILAPEKEHEFRRVCEALGGQFIQMGAGSPNRINIMEIFKRDETANVLIDGNHQRMSYLTEKVQSLKDFFILLIPDMTIEEKQLLDEAIMQTYANFGITTDNNSLIDPDDFMNGFKKMPIIEDLQKVLKANSRTERMANIINVLCSGSGKSFNGQTNVDLDNDFTVIGLEHLSGDMMPLGIYMAMDFVWSKIKEDRTKKKVLFIDEWWKLAYNPIAANYSLEIAKIIRAYGGAMVIATQQMNDILAVENGKFGEAVLNNCKTKILMQMEQKDAETVQRLIGINDSETEQIQHSGRGEGLFVSNDNNIFIKFVASDAEFNLITTDRTHLQQLMASKNSSETELFAADDMEFVDMFSVADEQKEGEKNE